MLFGHNFLDNDETISVSSIMRDKGYNMTGCPEPVLDL